MSSQPRREDLAVPAPKPRQQMSRPMVTVARTAGPARRLWSQVSLAVVTIAWLATLAPVWANLCAYPLHSKTGILAGAALALLAALAVSARPTCTPGWRTVFWAWFASLTVGGAVNIVTLPHMLTWAQWPTAAAVGTGLLVILARTDSTARNLVRLTLDLRYLR